MQPAAIPTFPQRGKGLKPRQLGLCTRPFWGRAGVGAGCSRQRWVAWLAVWLVLFAALAPVLSHALARGTAAPPGLEICTTSGTQIIALPGAATSAEPDAAPAPLGEHLLVHCPFCLLHADRLALPTHAPQWQAPPRLGVRVATLTCVVAYPHPPYNCAAARAPPAHA